MRQSQQNKKMILSNRLWERMIIFAHAKSSIVRVQSSMNYLRFI